MNYRQAIADYIRSEAQPPDKFAHQPRLYRLATLLGAGQHFDDDVLYAAAWLHDTGVFVGHRPVDLVQLAAWDNVAYALRVIPELLERFAFPKEKIAPVLEAIRTHQPSGDPASLEAVLLRDADILEQLGATGVVRMLSKVGRDTRYLTHETAIAVLRKAACELPDQLRLPLARELAKPRLRAMSSFFAAVDAEWQQE